MVEKERVVLKENMDRKKVVVGMSGGVDSSVAAWRLKEQGFDVIGGTMLIWQEELTELVGDDGTCCGLSAVDDARRVAEELGIPHYVLNFREIFKKTVIDNFISEYQHGRTPNPCNVCNRYVKWEALLDRAAAFGADYIATGHYARIVRLENGRYAIANAASAQKDQTYALYALTQDQLAHTLMPVGDYDKARIRQMAMNLGLNVATKPDSQDICFVPNGDYQSFIRSYTGCEMEKGNFIDKDGHVLGQHKGISAYTIGQRKGLNLAMGRPVYVTDIRPKSNEVVIGENEDLFARELVASAFSPMALESIKEPTRLKAKIRYAHRAADCTAQVLCDGRLRVCFDEPQRAMTPGQSVVLYDGELVAGGGIIETMVREPLK